MFLHGDYFFLCIKVRVFATRHCIYLENSTIYSVLVKALYNLSRVMGEKVLNAKKFNITFMIRT